MLKNLTSGILQRIIKKIQRNITYHIKYQENNDIYMWGSIAAIKLGVNNVVQIILIDIMLFINGEKRSDYA